MPTKILKHVRSGPHPEDVCSTVNDLKDVEIVSITGDYPAYVIFYYEI